MLLEGKVAVVTGSGAGLGRAYAIGLAKAGAKVIVNARTAADVADVVAEIRGQGGVAEGCVASVATTEGCAQVVQSALEYFTRIDILVNNAGILIAKPLTEMTVEDFDTVIATNLRSTFACTKEAVPHMIAQHWGRVINVSSGAVLGQPQASGYAASKGGISSLTLTWALDLAQYGITCNVIRASAHTRIKDRAWAARIQGALDQGLEPPQIPYLGPPPEMAAPLVVFLASEQAGGVNGQYLAVDGPRVSIWAHTQPVSSILMPGGWTPELLLEHFPNTLGTQLQDFGWKGIKTLPK